MTSTNKRDGGEVELPALSLAKDAPLRHGNTTILAGDYYTASQYANVERALAESRAEVDRLRGLISCPEHLLAVEANSQYARAERLAGAGKTLADFARTAPGRLPSRVQEAIAALEQEPQE